MLALASLAIGARPVPPDVVWAALTGASAHPDAIVVTGLRLPRTVVGILAGAALGIAGAVVQLITRNPIAEPGLLGVSAGAGLAVAASAGLLGLRGDATTLPAFAGALVVTAAVLLLSARSTGSAAALRLTLGGVAVAAVLTGLTNALTALHPIAFADVQGWSAGSLDTGGRLPGALPLVAIALGALLAAALVRPLAALALGDDVARGLGVATVPITLLGMVAVALLAGAATAIAGPLAFLGLLAPHTARLAGARHPALLLPLAAVLGAAALLLADVLGRVALPEGELPAGVMCAVIGAPVLCAVALRARSGSGG